MRRNHTTRPSGRVENYDVEYRDYPDMPEVREIINHPRKTRFINLCCTFLDGEIREVWKE